ncbi:helix-turn-helix transcriptional regulator [Mycolicibacterium fortuitum]|uniref:helix-turn-helix transcriptional regulator n=1 Tax=Mycolicibacterium fortuitum TaxID=1766 RepID=UPI001CDC2DDD|nr:helix-turn-helix domain-containing protein [Mycolicibacterium fortuitum]UBV14992.1 helix-turn-helix domain-containing protein [Mycolicibacterium fortuitum]
MTTDIITTRDVAQMAGVTERTVQQWRARGTGPTFTRIGATYVVYDRAEVERWIADVYTVGVESRAGRKPKPKGQKR